MSEPREWWAERGEIQTGVHLVVTDINLVDKELRQHLLPLVEKSAYDALAAENERLRAALERIIAIDPRLPDFSDRPSTMIAREALGRKEVKP